MLLRQTLLELTVPYSFSGVMTQIVTKVQMLSDCRMFCGVNVDVVRVVFITPLAKIMPTGNAVLTFANVAQIDHWLNEVIYGRNLRHLNQNIENRFGFNAGNSGAADVVDGYQNGLKDGR